METSTTQKENEMKTTIAIKTAALMAACGLMMISTSASAGVHWSVNVGIPAPVYVQPAPVYVQPQPVYVQPQPVYVQPAPVYGGVYYYDAYGRPYYRHHRHHHHGW